MSESVIISSAKVELEINIRAKKKHVWNALINEINAWWRRDFYAHPETKAFKLEPWVGGRLFEDAGNGNGTLWGHVHAMNAPDSIDFIGHMSPRWGGPATTMFRFELMENNAGGTLVKVTDAQMGRSREKAAGDFKEGWKLLITEGLKIYVEGNNDC